MGRVVAFQPWRSPLTLGADGVSPPLLAADLNALAEAGPITVDNVFTAADLDNVIAAATAFARPMLH